MSSTFSCYEISRSGMYVSQTALNTTGHNISNVSTTGYVRQQVISSDKNSLTYGENQIGTGVDVDEVRQIRSIFLDNMYRSENSSLNYWSKMQSTVEDVESVMSELSDDSLATVIDEFFNGWEELSKNPESLSIREALIEYGSNFVDTVNALSEQLDQIQEDMDSQIIDLVGEINSISQQVAELNGTIVSSELGGISANDYRDEANALLDTLSGYVNISVTEDLNGIYNVKIGGKSLVNGTTASKLDYATNLSNGDFVTVIWENTGEEIKLRDGELLGLIQSRGDVNGDQGSEENGSPVESGNEEADVDNDSDLYNFTSESDNFIPELRKGINMMVSLMTRKINAIHREGVGLDGSTGVDFFVKIDENLPFEAGNIQVNPELLEDANKIAASATGETSDASIANEIIEFKDTEYFQNDGLKMDINDFYSLVVNWIGIVGEEAEGFTSNQTTLVQHVENSKDALSAVSLDDEMTSLIKFQHAYNASAQVMNVMDSMIDKIINSTGVVGR